MARRQGGTLSGFTPLSTPSAPTIDSVTTSIGSASVAFTAPTDVGDAAVSSYVVTAVDESSGASTGATGSASPITVSGIGGQTVKIRMQALNAYGPGRLTEYDTGNVIYAGAELYAWGQNFAGNLGDNTTVARSSPVQIGALTTWASVSCGLHTASIKTDGTFWAWGRNNYGQIGDSTTVSRSSPVQVGALTNWSDVAISQAGGTTCSVKSDGTLWSWGDNTYGTLGQNVASTVFRSSPVQIGASTDWLRVAAGNSHVAAVKTNGTLWSWGRNNHGQIGDNTIANRSSPIQVGALSNWYLAACGNYHTIVTATNGALWTFGRNNNGQIGNNTIINRSSAVQVGALTTWSHVAGGNSHTEVVKNDGTLWAWGNNSVGELGDTTTVNRSSPIQIGALTTWSRVSAGGNNTAAIKTDGTLWTWGWNNNGQLGLNVLSDFNARRSSPTQVGALTNWSDVSVGQSIALALYGVV